MLNTLDTVQSGHKRGQRGNVWGYKKALNRKSKYLNLVAILATSLGNSPNSLGFNLFTYETEVIIFTLSHWVKGNHTGEHRLKTEQNPT